MVYALNVFNFIDGKEDDYREYSVKAGKIIYGKGGRVVSSGWNPIRKLHGDRTRKYMIVVEFPSEQIFQEFLFINCVKSLGIITILAVTIYKGALKQI